MDAAAFTFCLFKVILIFKYYIFSWRIAGIIV